MTRKDGRKGALQVASVITHREVLALMRFAMEKGLDPKGEIIPPLYASLRTPDGTPALQKSVTPDEGAENSEDIPISEVTSGLYAKLAKLTRPVSGRTLIDSDDVDYLIANVRWLTFWILLACMANGILNGWVADALEPSEGWETYVFTFQRYFFDYVGPFLWGALGSSFYLLKRYSDFAEDRVFDERSMQGWGTRILLGAVLGGVVQFIYDREVFTTSGLELDANALGFLTGIGVKVVYGAIEKTIDSLGQAMNLDAIRTGKLKNEDKTKQALLDEIDELDGADDPRSTAARQKLLDLLHRIESASI